MYNFVENFTGHITLKLNVALLLSILCVILFSALSIYAFKKRQHAVIRIIWFALLLWSTLYFTCFTITTITAYRHGCRDINNESVKSCQDKIKHTPIEDKLPKDLNNTILFFYRFDCSDCYAMEKSTIQLIKDLSNDYPNIKTYRIATRSKQGKKFRKDYLPIPSVPSIVYISKDNQLYYLSLMDSKSKTLNQESIKLLKLLLSKQ